MPGHVRLRFSGECISRRSILGHSRRGTYLQCHSSADCSCIDSCSRQAASRVSPRVPRRNLIGLHCAGVSNVRWGIYMATLAQLMACAGLRRLGMPLVPWKRRASFAMRALALLAPSHLEPRGLIRQILLFEFYALSPRYIV